MLTTRNRIVAWPIVSSDLWRDMNALNGSGQLKRESSWTPATSVVESDHVFTLRVEVPGVRLDSLEVELDGVHLSVSGEREGLARSEDERVHLSEMPWGRFERRFRLGSEVDRDGISASSADGILEIRVPKRQEARPRRIPVSTSN